MGTINRQISRYEVSSVYTHPQAKVDIVLVHGLNGDPQKTWTARSNGVFWPGELLPASLKGEPANILVYGYNADVYATRNERSPSTDFIHVHAQTLITTLSVYRKSEGTTRNPIVWVAHSLGGILVKRALLYSNDVRNTDHEPLRSIYVSTYGIIFLGTPHTGSDMATWGHVLQAMSDAVVPKKFFASEPVLLKTLKRDNEILQNINSHFLDVYQRFKILMAHENHMTDFKTSRGFVVDAASASPQLPGVIYFGIEATHSGMCKFEGTNAPGYRNVSTTIYEWVVAAPPVIQVRWAVEQEERLARAQQDVNERIRPFMPTRPTTGGQNQTQGTIEPNRDPRLLEPPPPQPQTRPQEQAHSQELAQSPPQPIPARNAPPDPDDNGVAATSPFPLVPIHSRPESRPELAHHTTSGMSRDHPLFIHPEPFRPNSYHVGRENEMRELHRLLMDRKRRVDGTSAVLLHGLPGGGKTHLARQYVFKHKNDYPGGIYWVRSKSVQEMESWFWRIAKTEAIRDSLESVAREAVDSLLDPRRIVEIVRMWFNSFEEWLIVFDGIHFDEPGVERFIPGAPNTAIIFTSTNKAVTGDYNFNNPEVITVDPLKAQEAQELLLTEMNKKKPWTTDDRTRAMDLVRLMGRLPQMIHIAAQQLKATQEPLSRYLKAYEKRPSAQAGSLPAYWAVYEQLQDRGATAALNLMSILSFFDQDVPVEMLALGLPALDARTPIKTRDASHKKPTLNNTLRVLIMFALVERVDNDDVSPTSSRSSKQGFERGGENPDILKMHSVVQAFFIHAIGETKNALDSSNSRNPRYDPVLFWLERAIAVFCRSYDEAERRIQNEPHMGLPDDYHRYEIHAHTLLKHLDHFDKKQTIASVREDLSRRAALIQQAVYRLSHRVQTHIVTSLGNEGDEDVLPTMSVFDERTSSQSETDTDSPESRRSLSGLAIPDQHPSRRWLPDATADGHLDRTQPAHPGQHESPTSFTPTQATAADFHNPYHFHVPFDPPYPDQSSMPPAPPMDGDDGDAQTVVPDTRSPQIPQPGSGSSEKAAASPWSPAQPNSPTWQLVTSHRTVKKNESRRYHDRAGAWRDRTVSDPRSSISRETAKVSRFSAREGQEVLSPSPGNAGGASIPPKTTAESGARMILDKLKGITSPTAPSSSSVLQDKTNRPDAQQQPHVARPTLITGNKGSYANVAAGRPISREQDAPASPGEFNNRFKKTMSLSSSPSSWTSATLKKLINFRPKASSRATTTDQTAASTTSELTTTDSKGTGGGKSSSSTVAATTPAPEATGSSTTTLPTQTQTQTPLTVANPKTAHSEPSLSPRASPLDKGKSKETPPLPPSPLFLGSRSANSSPGQATSPFPPPPSGSVSGSGQPEHRNAANVGAVQRWESQIYHPGRSRLETSELIDGFPDDYNNPMTRSMPSIRDNNGTAAGGGGAPGGRSYYSQQSSSPPRRYQQGQGQGQGWQQQQQQQQLQYQPSYQINVHPPSQNVGHGGAAMYSHNTPPDGYSSLPMSRDTSGGAPTSSSSGAGTSSGCPIPPGGGGGPPPQTGTSRSSPTGGPSYPAYRSASPNRNSQQHQHAAQMLYGHGHGSHHGTTPSDTRTEPSPRMGPSPFPDVDTSYRMYEERHGVVRSSRRGRGRAGSSGSYDQHQRGGGGATTSATQRGVSSVSAGAAAGYGYGYSRSQSPSPNGLYRSGGAVPRRPLLPGAWGAGNAPVSFTAPPGSSPDLSSSNRGGADGSEMARSAGSQGSGSVGGFKVGDRIIEFGNVPVDVVEAGQRARRLEREISMGSETRRRMGVSASRSRSREQDGESEDDGSGERGERGDGVGLGITG